MNENELYASLMRCGAMAAEILEGKDNHSGEALDAIGIQIKLTAITREAEMSMREQVEGEG